MTVLEAMSVGTPVVVTNSCGLAADVEQAGAGAVVAPDVRSLAGATVRLLRDGDLREAAGAAGRLLAGERFGIGAVVDRLEAVYRSLCDPASRPALPVG